MVSAERMLPQFHGNQTSVCHSGHRFLTSSMPCRYCSCRRILKLCETNDFRQIEWFYKFYSEITSVGKHGSRCHNGCCTFVRWHRNYLNITGLGFHNKFVDVFLEPIVIGIRHFQCLHFVHFHTRIAPARKDARNGRLHEFFRRSDAAHKLCSLFQCPKNYSRQSASIHRATGLCLCWMTDNVWCQWCAQL